MLPPQLSDDLCSLKPNQDRLVFSAVFTIHKGEIIDRWFGKAIINSKRRFTYDEADETLKNASALLHTELAQVWEYASMVRQKRFDDGAVMFGTDEIKPIVDVLTGEVTSFKRVQYTESHQLIEELMLLANREVATLVSKRLGKKNRVFVYRIHDVPNAEKMEELAIFLRAIGYQLSLGKKASGKDINKLLKQLEGKPEERLIKTATIRSMAKAIYTTKNIGHFGLAFEDYAHFTSPIRRYPDVMVHRTLFTVISGNPVTDNHEAQEKRAVHASEREVAAAEAERGSIKLKQVEFFAKKIGEIRSGVVSGVSEWGLYIADVETATEGMARLTTLTDDTYEHQPKRFAVIGSRSKRVIQMGDPVTYRIEKANIADRTLDFSIIPTQ
jgi:ribonuclease R